MPTRTSSVTLNQDTMFGVDAPAPATVPVDGSRVSVTSWLFIEPQTAIRLKLLLHAHFADSTYIKSLGVFWFA